MLPIVQLFYEPSKEAKPQKLMVVLLEFSPLTLGTSNAIQRYRFMQVHHKKRCIKM